MTSLKIMLYGSANLFHSVDFTSCTTAVSSNLRDLAIGGSVRWILPSHGSGLHLPNLQQLSLSTDVGCDIAVVLGACPNISKLSIDVRSVVGENYTENITVPHLTTISVLAGEIAASNLLMDRLHCPSLRKFHLTTLGVVDALSLRRIKHFISRSTIRDRPSSSLKALHLEYSPSFQTEYSPNNSVLVQILKEILRPLSDLNDLRLYNVFINEEIVKCLTPLSGGRLETKEICPFLECLCLGCTYVKSAALNDALEEMVISRWKSRRGPLDITLAIESFKGARKRQRIKECLEEGLEGHFSNVCDRIVY
ncbi:hypothetical protein SCHPADRAFT_942559 [Schizopora paradoxa]|uniref:F-box domain-containing protein n=1 Tax=Schizopora paradoxa TaxID=27342 RepID=A0A0H2S163_9AGAM|nr:hypothetical protein SCHPADRAFT_942559 [Schizopora paradoxa]